MGVLSDPLAARALTVAAALLEAAAKDDRFAMRRILKITNEPSTDDTVGQIVGACATYFRVQIGEILGDSKVSEVARARMTACYIAKLHGYTYKHIGRMLSRDHSTVMHAVSRVSADPMWRREAESIAADTGWAGAA